eukprot:GILJ01001940.1.p1 GENE.GILJ01001940.1~~GILJ01001940.1.p1  ORF type:complete len:721 (-),score=134.09 GILJ01001940.1:132-2294(-)
MEMRSPLLQSHAEQEAVSARKPHSKLSRAVIVAACLCACVGLAVLYVASASPKQDNIPDVSLSSVLLNDMMDVQESFLPDESDVALQLLAQPALASCLGDGQLPVDQMARLSEKEKLALFIKGRCLPVVLIPGVLASRLRIEIDCPTLRDKSPAAFESCGWNACEGKGFKKSVPNKEYDVWVPDEFAPLSVVGVRHRNCWVNLFKLHLNDSTGTVQFTDTPGVKISPYGLTPETKQYSNCGTSGTDGLNPDHLPFRNKQLQVFRFVSQALLSRGYQAGVTMFNLPYDWRREVQSTNVQLAMEKQIRLAYRLTGKKVLVVGHSMGNLNALYTLNRMSQADKDLMIHRFLAVNPPFLGAHEVVYKGINGIPAAVGLGFGLDVPAQRDVFHNLGSVLELLPKNSFEIHRDAAWLQQVRQRLALESELMLLDADSARKRWQELVDNDNVPLPWFPNALAQCSNKAAFDKRDPRCFLPFVDYATHPFLEIVDEPIQWDQASVNAIVKRGVFNHDTNKTFELYSRIAKNELNQVNNPNVAMDVVYMAHVPTRNQERFTSDPAIVDADGQPPSPVELVSEVGDGSVTATSALFAGIKWAHEYIHKTNPNAKEVMLVEYCSSFDSTAVPYKFNGPFKGMLCECSAGGYFDHTGSSCNHRNILRDPKFVEYVVDSSFVADTSVPLVQGAPEVLPDKALWYLNTECPVLDKSIPVDIEEILRRARAAADV